MHEQPSAKLWSPLQVADFLSIKLARVYELARTQRLRAVRVGRLLRFKPEEIERFVERNTEGRP
jgi:excisionase family DNA binding protein